MCNDEYTTLYHIYTYGHIILVVSWWLVEYINIM